MYSRRKLARVLLIREADVDLDRHARDLFTVECRAIQQRDRVVLEAIPDRDQLLQRHLVSQRVDAPLVAQRGTGRDDEVARRRLEQHLDQVARPAFADTAGEPRRLQLLQVVVHLLAGLTDRAGDGRRRGRRSQRLQDAQPQRVEQRLHRFDVADDVNPAFHPDSSDDSLCPDIFICQRPFVKREPAYTCRRRRTVTPLPERWESTTAEET